MKNVQRGEQVMVTLRRRDRRGHIPTEQATVTDVTTSGNMAMLRVNRTGEIVGRWLVELRPAAGGEQ